MTNRKKKCQLKISLNFLCWFWFICLVELLVTAFTFLFSVKKTDTVNTMTKRVCVVLLIGWIVFLRKQHGRFSLRPSLRKDEGRRVAVKSLFVNNRIGFTS
jgi:hypothetical protein